MNSVLRNAGGEAAFVHLNSDGDSVYGTGFDYGGGPEDDFEGTFRASWSDGTLIWMTDCHGDTYGVYPMGDVIYTSGHAHYCGNIGAFPQTDPWTMHHSLAMSKAPTGQKITPDIWGYRSFTGQQAPTLLHWYPDWVVGSYTTSGQAAWQVTGNSQYVLYAGEFTGVAGKKQQGLVRFAKPPTAPDKIGPRVSSTKWVLSGNSIRSNEIRLRWTANNDPDDSNLTYQVLRRDRGTTPLWTGQVNSNFWTTPIMSYRDTTVVAGQTYEYRIKVLDPHGNTTSTEYTAFTASTGVVGTAYDDAVIEDNPVDYWPMSEASGSTAFDWSGVSDLTLGSGATRAVAGPEPDHCDQCHAVLRHRCRSRRLDAVRPRSPGLHGRGMVQDQQQHRRKDHRLRKLGFDLEFQQLRSARLPRAEWTRDVRPVSGRCQDGDEPEVLQRQRVAPRRRFPRPRRPDPVRRRRTGLPSGRRHERAGVQRLLARRG